jgi:hypothetical protein
MIRQRTFHRLVLAVLLALSTLACASISQLLPGGEEAGPQTGRPAGYILYWHLFDENREPVDPELVILSAEGEELLRVAWSEPDEPMTLRIYDSPAKDQALLYAMSDPAAFYLVDLPKGTVRPLASPAGLDEGLTPLPLLGGAAGGWLALGGPRGTELALLDTAGGRIVDLLALRPEMEPIFGGLFNEDGSYYLAFGHKVWLVPLADPAATRLVGGDSPRRANIRAGGFSADGRSMIYSRYLVDVGQSEIIVEELVSGTAETVTTLDGPFAASFIPASDQILLAGDRLVLIGPDGDEVWTAGGQPCPGLYFGPGGRSAVCQSVDDWAFVDLAGGQVTALTSLAGYTARSGRSRVENQWLVLMSGDGKRLAAVDMSDGQVTELLSAGPDEGTISPVLFISPDGRYVVANFFGGEGEDKSWLLDAADPARPQVRSLAGMVPAVIAPDNCCLLAGLQGQVVRQELLSGDESALGAGAFPAWIR